MDHGRAPNIIIVSNKTVVIIQIIRYVIVGLISNLILFGAYIYLTTLGVGPKIAMSVLYILGVIQTFVFNKRWSFRFNGSFTPALMRYATSYILGYVINFSAFMLLVDRMGFPHQWVQGVMIVSIAILLFIAQRYWVFAPSKRSIRV